MVLFEQSRRFLQFLFDAAGDLQLGVIAGPYALPVGTEAAQDHHRQPQTSQHP